MPLSTNVTSLATRVATEFKTIRAITGALTSLTTTNKTNLVSAINELQQGQAQAGAQINDTVAGTGTVYSSSKTEAHVAERIAALVAGSPGLLDTLDEIAAAIGDDPNFAATISTALGNRVRYDAAQTLDSTQKAQARSNIGAGISDLAIGTTASTAKAGNYQPAAADISNASTVGRNVLTAVDASAARSAIGAGTGSSNLVLGTTAGTAAAGNDSRLSDARTPTTHTHTSAQISDSTTVGRSVLVAADATAARTAIGAGTGSSNLVIGTSAGQAADAAAVGNTEADFVATFNAGLL